ncbi:hypothetical protein ABBQ38_006813 [Trebouxia sp. C0009 RCD-2024]
MGGGSEVLGDLEGKGPLKVTQRLCPDPLAWHWTVQQLHCDAGTPATAAAGLGEEKEGVSCPLVSKTPAAALAGMQHRCADAVPAGKMLLSTSALSTACQLPETGRAR